MACHSMPQIPQIRCRYCDSQLTEISKSGCPCCGAHDSSVEQINLVRIVDNRVHVSYIQDPSSYKLTIISKFESGSVSAETISMAEFHSHPLSYWRERFDSNKLFNDDDIFLRKGGA